MNYTKPLGIGIIVIAIMSISFLISPSAISSALTMMNSTAPFTPSGTIALFSEIVSSVALLVSGLLWLYKHWKDRNWKRKYKDIIVAKPFP